MARKALFRDSGTGALDDGTTTLAGTADVAADTHAATSKTTPVDADELPLADSAASFALKKLTWANLKATLKAYFDTLYASSSGSAPIGTPELIYRYTVTGSDKASIDTGSDTPDAGSNDWSGGDRLEIYLYARTDETAVASSVNITLNNDTGGNYDIQSVAGASTTASAVSLVAQSNFQFSVDGASAAANVFAVIELCAVNYTGTVGFKPISAFQGRPETTAANQRVAALTGQYRSTSAITRFAVTPNTAGKKLKVGTQLLIYKRRAS